MSISCVILNFNDFENSFRLSEKIRRFNSLDYVIIVDNCSTDDSYVKLLEAKRDKVHVIRTQRNGGYGYGNNFGIKFAYNELKTKYTLIANPDVDFEEECIIKLKETIETVENCAVISPVPYKPNGSVQNIVAWKLPNVFEYVLTASALVCRFYLLERLFYGAKSLDREDVFEVGCVAGSLLLVDTEIMVKYGMYDEEIFLYGEETVLGLKMKMAGFKTLLRVDQIYIHQHSATINKTFSTSIKKQKIMLESHLKLLKKYYHIKGTKLLLAKVFFRLTIFEVLIKQFIKKSIMTKNS